MYTHVDRVKVFYIGILSLILESFGTLVILFSQIQKFHFSRIHSLL